MKFFHPIAKAALSWFLAGTVVLAQTPAPNPAPGADQPILRVTTRLIQLNVVAQDRHGNPVTDLTKDDFILKDAGKEQSISVFSLEREDLTNATEPGPGQVLAGQKLPPGTFTNRVEQKVGAVTVILFDALNTKMTDQIPAKAQMIKYLKQMSPNDQIALYVLGRDLRLVHDFSRSTESLIKAINGEKNNAISSLAEQGDPADPDTGNDDLDAAISRADQMLADYANVSRAQSTLEALQVIGQHVAHIPGRKNLVWVSSGFPFSINQDEMNIDNPRDSRNFNEEAQKMARFLNDANLAIYAIDARGLFQTAIPDASQRGKVNTRSAPPPPKIDHAYETFDIVAERTGGKAFHNTNDITGAIKRAVEDARVTYTLGFYPADAKWDGQFHQLKLQCKRSGVTIHYRPGYFATNLQPKPVTHRFANVQQAIQSTVMANEIGFTVHVEPKAAAIVAQIVVDPRNLTLTEQDGKWVGQLQFYAVSGNATTGQFTGKPMTVNLKFPPEAHETVLKSGLKINHTFNIEPGTNQFRIAMQDVPSGAIGSLIVSSRPAPAQVPATGSPRVAQGK